MTINEVHFSQNTWNVMRAHQPCCQKQWSGPGRSGGDDPGFEVIGGRDLGTIKEASCIRPCDSSDCLDWVVPVGMSQISRRSEVRNHKWHTLNTQLFLALLGNFAVCAPKQVPDMFFCTTWIQRKGWKIGPHVSNSRSRYFHFRRVQVHPWQWPIFVLICYKIHTHSSFLVPASGE